MTITVLLDPAQMPDQSQDQLDFDNKMSGLMRDLPAWGAQANALEASLSAMAAGGAYALPYVFDTATADADPGAGKLRLSSSTQNAATVMRLDLTAGGQDYTALIDTMDASTSVTKGSIRLVKQGDPSKWMTFDVTARASPTGYRNLTVACTGSSSASPFVKDDAVLLFFQRNGDRGQQGASGVIALATATVTTPVVNIDFLNIFSADFDRYTIELQGLMVSNGASVGLRLAYGGVVNLNASSYYSMAPGGSVNNDNNFLLSTVYPARQASIFTVDIRDTNSVPGAKGIGVRGCGTGSDGSVFGVWREGADIRAGVASGFRLLVLSSGINFTSGIVRVYGHRNT